jgi:hypothetical protein
MIAVKIPSAGAEKGVAVPAGILAIPKARAKGRAISPTVIPASSSPLRENPSAGDPKISRILG